MTKLYYLTNARLPTEKANGYQIMKTCEAFSKNHLETKITYPQRIQSQSLASDPFEYYQIDQSFKLQKIFGLDWLHIFAFIHPKIEKYGFLLQAFYNASMTLLLTVPKWYQKDVTFFSRDLFITYVLLCFRPLIRCKILFESHRFPESKTEKIIKRFKKLDGLVCITENLKRLFIENGYPEEKIFVAHDAVDLDQFELPYSKMELRTQLGLPADKKIIGYIGRFQTMGMEKGVPELIKSMKSLIENSSEKEPLLLCVGGPMELVDKYLKIADDYGVSHKHILFVDRVPNTEVSNWVKACDVVTIPWCWNNFSAYYTSPMKLFEYMASGVPIVASDLPSLGEILTHNQNALLSEAGNVEKLAESIQTLLDNPEQSEKLGQQALEDVQQFTWDQRAKNIFKFIECL